jgi:hypothetical protein
VFSAPSPAPAPAEQRFAYWSENQAATAESDADDEPDEPRHRARTALLIVAGLVVVVLLGIGGWLLLGGREDGAQGGDAGGSSASPDVPPGPQVGDVQTVAGTGFTVGAVDLTDTCTGHAYGAVAEFLGATDCVGLARALYSTEVDGEAVVVSVARVQMPDAAAARELRGLADQNGSGNVSDLLREGVRYPGSPAELSGAEYASAVSGPTVTIVEAAWVAEDAPLGAAEIDRVAGEGLALEVPPFPAA